ncbi:MAG: hypothetical protein IAG13_01740 [Deltaproteobacteria bacterium]|nr:hypothetical protein [Nannocystaceae bacterium]
MGELLPERVAQRLARLRELYEPLDLAGAAAQMQAPRTSLPILHPSRVAARLEELRALMELTDYLHGHAPSDGRAHDPSR